MVWLPGFQVILTFITHSYNPCSSLGGREYLWVEWVVLKVGSDCVCRALCSGQSPKPATVVCHRSGQRCPAPSVVSFKKPVLHVSDPSIPMTWTGPCQSLGKLETGGSPPASASFLSSLVHPCVSLHLAVFLFISFFFSGSVSGCFCYMSV